MRIRRGLISDFAGGLIHVWQENDMREKEYREEIVALVKEKGHPAELGMVIADSLGTEKTMIRMIGYLSRIGEQSAEDMVDEMLAICQERDRWQEKKASEYYQEKYNQYLFEKKMEEDD